MKQRFFLLLAAVLVVVAFGCSHLSGVGSPSPTLDKIQKNGKLVVGTAANMPPLNMKTRSGRIIGLDIDLARYMAESMGVELELVTKPFAELLPALEAKEVDMVISGMTITPERNLRVEFAGPYHLSGKSFLTKKSTIASITDPSLLNSSLYSFAVLAGSTSEVLVKAAMPSANLRPVTNYNEGVDLVLNNQADAMVSDYHACIVALFQHPNQGLAAITTRFTYEPLGIALPPGDVHLLNWVNNFLGALEGSDALVNLKMKWIEDASWLDQLP